MNNKEETRACSMLIVGPPKQGKSPMMIAAMELFCTTFGESVTIDILDSRDGKYDTDRLCGMLKSLGDEICIRSEEDRLSPHVLAIDDYDLFVMFESRDRQQEYRHFLKYILENGSQVGVYVLVTTWHLKLGRNKIIDESLFPLCRILA